VNQKKSIEATKSIESRDKGESFLEKLLDGRASGPALSRKIGELDLAQPMPEILDRRFKDV
jgi:hypothetical protein